MPERRAFVTIADAADYLGVTTRTILQMIADGKPAFKWAPFILIGE